MFLKMLLDYSIIVRSQQLRHRISRASFNRLDKSEKPWNSTFVRKNFLMKLHANMTRRVSYCEANQKPICR
jgi:hypothetical protein